jgi:2'-5' RNA ligase
MSAKTHTTAVVLIPPVELWPPIQAIRQRYDRHFRRWMPHITLLYPFRPRAEFDRLVEALTQACRRVAPFRVELAELQAFRHRQQQFTLWLAPQPQEALRRLQAAVGRVAPDCDDVARHRDGFTPHLSVGQVQGELEMEHLRRALQATWRPLSFTARAISLIWRAAPPDDVFRVAYTVPLGTRGEAPCRT